LIEALLVLWLIVVTEPFWLIVAAPVVTVPPVGEAKLMVLPAINAETTREIFPPLRIRKRELKSGVYFIVFSLRIEIRQFKS
jgi:hypothetical protein